MGDKKARKEFNKINESEVERVKARNEKIYKKKIEARNKAIRKSKKLGTGKKKNIDYLTNSAIESEELIKYLYGDFDIEKDKEETMKDLNKMQKDNSILEFYGRAGTNRVLTDEEWQKMFKYMRAGCTKLQVQAMLMIGSETLTKVIKKKFGNTVTFDMIKTVYNHMGEADIMGAIYEEAVDNRNTAMLKFVASTRLGINEKTEQVVIVSDEESNRLKDLFNSINNESLGMIS